MPDGFQRRVLVGVAPCGANDLSLLELISGQLSRADLGRASPHGVSREVLDSRDPAERLVVAAAVERQLACWTGRGAGRLLRLLARCPGAKSMPSRRSGLLVSAATTPSPCVVRN